MTKDPAQKLYDRRLKDALKDNDGLAVASLLASILAWPLAASRVLDLLAWPAALVGILSGLFALYRLSRSQERGGRALAVTGMILGMLEVAFLVLTI